MQPSSAWVGSTSALNASSASASLPATAVNEPTTTTSDMRAPPGLDAASYAAAAVPAETAGLGAAPPGDRVDGVDPPAGQRDPAGPADGVAQRDRPAVLDQRDRRGRSGRNRVGDEPDVLVDPVA